MLCLNHIISQVQGVIYRLDSRGITILKKIQVSFHRAKTTQLSLFGNSRPLLVAVFSLAPCTAR